MIITKLQVDNLRVLKHLVLHPVPGLNLIVGNNGTGKTSVLEALYLLGYGRSFRHREASPLIRDGEKQALVVSRLLDKDGLSHVLGISRSNKDFIARWDGQDIKKRSALIQKIPIQWIGPSPQELITGPPQRRRQLIDQGLFHVEHDYLDAFQRYSRLLAQRNEALKKGSIDIVSTWDAGLAQAGEALHQLRVNFVSSILEGYIQQLVDWNQGIDIDVRYAQGWPEDKPLYEVLLSGRKQDLKQKFTGCGPHRADLVIKLKAGKAGARLSRGQLKMSSVALQFALTGLIRQKTGVRPLLLIDDLTAELDERNRQRLLSASAALFPQVFAATLSPNDIPIRADKVFHVEPGLST